MVWAIFGTLPSCQVSQVGSMATVRKGLLVRHRSNEVIFDWAACQATALGAQITVLAVRNSASSKEAASLAAFQASALATSQAVALAASQLAFQAVAHAAELDALP